jgi:hypothetical protein
MNDQIQNIGFAGMKDYVVPQPPPVKPIADWKKAPAPGAPSQCIKRGNGATGTISTTTLSTTSVSTSSGQVSTIKTTTTAATVQQPTDVVTMAPPTAPTPSPVVTGEYDCMKEQYHQHPMDCRKVGVI